MKKVFLISIIITVGASAVFSQDRVLLDSIVCYSIYGSDSVYYSKECFEFDKHNQIIFEGEYSWKNGSKSWQTENYVQRVFDSEGNPIIEETFRRAVPWTYVDEYLHHEKTYYENGNLRSDSISIKSLDKDEWYPRMKYEYIYSPDNQLIRSFYWGWSYNYDKWSPPRKTEYSYNSNKDILSITYYGIDNNNQWIISSTSPQSFEYDDQGRLLKNHYETWDYDIPIDALKEYSYPTDSSREITTYWKHLRDTSYWRVSQEEDIFTQDGLILSHIYKTPNSSEGFVPMEKKTWTYDENYRITYLTTSERSGSSWKVKRRSNYYYKGLLSSTLSKVISETSIFPNPTSGIINISSLTQPAEVKIYSMQGQLLKSENLVGNLIDVSELADGVYVLKVVTDNHTLFKRLVVKR